MKEHNKENDDIIARFQFDHTIEADEVRLAVRVYGFPMPKQFLARLRRILDEARKQERERIAEWVEKWNEQVEEHLVKNRVIEIITHLKEE